MIRTAGLGVHSLRVGKRHVFLVAEGILATKGELHLDAEEGQHCLSSGKP